MTKTKSCFVVMPILGDGTPEHAHFRALYEEVFKATIEPQGYEVKRADDYKKGGAITKDIIVPLAEADLVIADLTDLNPNVFYELGIRHSLRGKGTIMVMEDRQERIPFDIGAYRVIRFKSDLAGVGKLRRELLAFVQGLSDNEDMRRDNPVHDWLPSLPFNALQSSRGSSEGELRTKIAKLQDTLRDYQERFGRATDGGSGGGGPSPLSVVMDALSEANDGNSPVDLIDQAGKAAAARDVKTLLSVVRRALELRVAKPTIDQFIFLVRQTLLLDQHHVAAAILEHTRAIYPKDNEIRRQQLELFAHSPDPANRERARRELMAEIGLQMTDESVAAPDHLNQESVSLMGIMLDAFHADDLHRQALRITEAVVKRFPNMTVVLRNHARALENANRFEESVEWYKKAINCSDADDTSAIWFGTDLHSRKLYVDACEVFTRACLLDPDDGAGFSRFADALSLALARQMVNIKSNSERLLPAGVGSSVAAEAVVACFSCPYVRPVDQDRCKRTLARLDLALDAVMRRVEAGEGMSDTGDMGSVQGRLTRKQRLDFAISLSQKFSSNLTQPSN